MNNVFDNSFDYDVTVSGSESIFNALCIVMLLCQCRHRAQEPHALVVGNMFYLNQIFTCSCFQTTRLVSKLFLLSLLKFKSCSTTQSTKLLCSTANKAGILQIVTKTALMHCEQDGNDANSDKNCFAALRARQG